MQRWGRILAAAVLAGCMGSASFSESAPPTTLLSIMQTQLQHNMQELQRKASPPPYFLSYDVTDDHTLLVEGELGAIVSSTLERHRILEVEARVGDYGLDNTHGSMMIRGGDAELPLEDDPAALVSCFWQPTDAAWESASQQLPRIKAMLSVRAHEEDKSPDFSREEPQRFMGTLVSFHTDPAAWEKRIRQYSGLFKPYPWIHRSEVAARLSATNDYLVTSEGTALQFGSTPGRIEFLGVTRAEDGMQLYRELSYDPRDWSRFPDDATVARDVARMAADLKSLRTAPILEPYSGPAILSGRAAGDVFHEILGHRMEGHRQKSEDEGQTFSKKVDQAVLPDFISVIDDPTLPRIGDQDLLGYYPYDDEGIQAQRVVVIDKGVLKSFLMSRSPAAGFNHSNGHGRRQTGFHAVGRQGNLLVQATQTVSPARLREMLVEECRRQGKPFGLYIDDISGGFTSTLRSGPQAFEVQPTMAYKVFVDGRPDELVRGVELVGTPLISFSRIMACGNDPAIFNGICGAESGSVPVSAVAPSLLTGQIETQKARQSTERMVLPPPAP